jgi:dTDP-4-amino-4,6-dideoxygalactose transaminase
VRDGPTLNAPRDLHPAATRAVPMLDLSREYARIGPELLAAVEEVLEAQNFILGRQVADFETAAAACCHVAHAVGCSSGTDALWLCLAAAAIGAGDAVVTTPFSFFATASSILRAGAQPVLADIDPRTFNLDPDAVDLVLSGKPAGKVKAVLPVHLYGQVAQWDRFEALKAQYGVLLIEDAAQAFGAAWDGAPAGSLGDLAAFSFYPTKNLSAGGDAGMVTTVDAALAERVRMLRAHGMRRRYYHDELGWNCRLDTLQAAILLVKMKYIAEGNDRRRALAASYDGLFAAAGVVEAGPYPSHRVVLPWTHPRATHVFHQYVVRVSRRDALAAHLRQRRIGCEVYYPVPLHLQAAFKGLGYRAGDFPESERAAAEVLALPMYPDLTLEEQKIVVDAIVDFLS